MTPNAPNDVLVHLIDSLSPGQAPDPDLRRFYDVVELTEGMYNATLRATVDGQSWVIQRLHVDYPPDRIEDFASISNALGQKGLVTPQYRLFNGLPWLRRHGHYYRCYPFIEGQSGCPAPSAATAGELGRFLRVYHRAARDLHPSLWPRSVIPHFHDFDHYMVRLAELTYAAPSTQWEHLASQALDAHDVYRVWPTAEKQLIHGDPRVNNIVFRDDLPYALVDFDTFMPAHPGTDLGDMLRSLCCPAGPDNPVAQHDAVLACAQGYDAQYPDAALWAMARISWELTARFLIDAVEDRYFGWDAARYTSRVASDMACATAQAQVARWAQEWRVS